VGSERWGAGGNSRIERRTVNTYIRNRGRGLDRCSGHEDGRARQFSDVNMQRRHLRPAHPDCHRMLGRVT